MPFRIGVILRLLRAEQWIKNLFVFAAPVFGKELAVPAALEATLAALASFCAASSAVYITNDLFDLARDRKHPLKRSRPLASGQVTPLAAGLFAGTLAILALGLAAGLTNPLTTSAIAAYMILNIGYSWGIKHWVIVDVMFIALGFLLRVLAGAFATHSEPSYWLLLCTLNIALFLGFVKRRSELRTLREDATHHRAVLEYYSPAFLDQMVAIVTSTTLVCYILYTVDSRTVSVFGTRLLVLTVPSVMYGLFRYLYLSYHLNEGGNPSKTVIADVPFLANLTLWILICLTVIYGQSYLGNWIDLLK